MGFSLGNININSIGGQPKKFGNQVKRQKTTLASIIFIVVGLLFVAVGPFVYSLSKIDDSWKIIKGTISDVSSHSSDGSTMYAPIVTYIVDGKSYNVTNSISTSSSPTIGGKMDVAYNPNKPDEAKVKDDAVYIFILGFPAIGGICAIVGAVIFVKSRKRTEAIRGLIQTGYKAQGVITDIQEYRHDNEHSVSYIYKVTVSAPDISGVTQQYISDSLTGDNLSSLDYKSRQITVDVYIDVVNPKNYYVDISDIPSLISNNASSVVDSSNINPTQPPALVS